MPKPKQPTLQTFQTAQAAFDFFNKRFWNNKLPPVMFLLHRKSSSAGYYREDSFRKINGQGTLPELSVSPCQLKEKDVMQTILHEMCHHWQACFGDTGSRGYHNTEWATEMQRVELMPSTTGEPGGKTTGFKMSDYPIKGGAFNAAMRDWKKTREKFEWFSPPEPKKTRQAAEPTTAGEKSVASKTKFSCTCGLNAWAKPTAHLVCGDCSTTMTPEN